MDRVDLRIREVMETVGLTRRMMIRGGLLRSLLVE